MRLDSSLYFAANTDVNYMGRGFHSKFPGLRIIMLRYKHICGENGGPSVTI